MENKESESKQEDKQIEHNCIFSKEKVNLGHQPEIDYVKALCVFLIVLQHIYQNFTSDSSEFIFMIMYVLSNSITPATALMLLMGIGMKYLRRNLLRVYYQFNIFLDNTIFEAS